MDKLYVLDASSYLYSSYFAIRNMTNSKGESTNALFGFIRSVLKIYKDFQPAHIVSVFDGPRNSKKRTEIYAQYKAHRQVTPPDLRYQIERAQSFCELMGLPFLSIPEVEADDTMGSIAVWAKKHGTSVYLCSSDKDLCQLVDDKVSLLNTHKDNLIIGPKEVQEIHGIPPNLMIDYLAITGDASDNVPGLPGFGPKTAAKLLHQFGSLDNILSNPSAITETKKRETVLQQGDQARLSRTLVTIDIGVEIPLDQSFYELRAPSYVKLKEFYASMNFNSLLRELELEHQKVDQIAGRAPEKTTEEYVLVDDEESFEQLLKYLSQQKQICFDTETTDVQPIKAELAGIGFGVEEGKAWYVPVNGNLGLQRVLEGVKPLFENHRIGFYGHNVKYDYHVLENYKIRVANICFDTILASYLLNSQSRQHSLDALSLENFGKVKISISELIGKGKNIITMCEVDIPKVCHYCCEDVDYTVRLKSLFEKQLNERKLGKLYFDLELPLVKVLAHMERTGIFLDVPHLHEISKEVTHQIFQLQNEIYELAGVEFNLNSPKQLIAIFEKLGIKGVKKTPTGQMRTDSDVLEELQKIFPIAGKLLEYRGLEKLRSTYIESLPEDVNPKTHRIHCTFNQSVAATGRLSCQDPNLQNIPVRSEVGRRIREAFRPEKKGWSYLAADYSQIELRLLAHFSEDPNLLHAFDNNEDIHAYTASLIFNTPLKEVTKELRQQAKAVNFGVIYGQQAFGLSQELGIDVKSASVFIEMYFARYSRVKEYVEYCKEKARQTGKAVTMTGRERAIPEILSKNINLRNAAERLSMNTPLQGTAADLIKMAMLKMDQYIQKHKKQCAMILQIHDELIFEIPDFEILEMEHVVKQTMQDVMKLKIPLVVDIIVGKNWKEC